MGEGQTHCGGNCWAQLLDGKTNANRGLTTQMKMINKQNISAIIKFTTNKKVVVKNLFKQIKK